MSAIIGQKVAFTGEWTKQVYEGVVDDWMSQGPMLKVNRQTAERIVADQERLIAASGPYDAGHLILTKTALVCYEPMDKQFYVNEFDEEGLVRIPSWTWYITDMTSAEEIVAILRDVGLRAHLETGPSVTEFYIPAPGGSIMFARQHNREDGGWEGAYDTGGDQVGLEPDGPSAWADAIDVAQWAVKLWCDTAPTVIDTPA